MFAASIQPSLEPASVGLKFAFLAVLYLFILWVARSALKDLRHRPESESYVPVLDDATSAYAASAGLAGASAEAVVSPCLEVVKGAGLRPGDVYELHGGEVIGRGGEASIKLEDQFVSTAHLRFSLDAGLVTVEDLDSTNGTYLNGERFLGIRPLHDGDRIELGSTEFQYRRSTS